MAKKPTKKQYDNAAFGLASHLATMFGGTAVRTKDGAAIVLKKK